MMARSCFRFSQPIQAAWVGTVHLHRKRSNSRRRSDGSKTVRPFAMTAYRFADGPRGFEGSDHFDLAGMRVPAKSLPIHREHDPERIVAHTDHIDLTERRLRVSGFMSGVGPAAQEVLQLADNGFPWQASIGASVEKKEDVHPGSSVRVNGRNWDGPLVVARKTTLREISFVSMGADPTTSATVAGGES